MVKKLFIYFSILFFILFLSACTSSPDPVEISKLVEIEYPLGETLTVGQLFPTYYVGIHNYSDQCIMFPVDYGIKLFMKNGDKISEIKNIVKYKGTEIKLSQKGTYFADNVITFMPDLDPMDYSASTSFYATIQGYLCDDKETIIDKAFDFSVKQ